MRIVQRLLCLCLSVSLLTADLPVFALEDPGRSVPNAAQKTIAYKDVTGIAVYKQEGQKTVLQEHLPTQGAAVEDYLVLVKMKELPGFYAKIKEFVKEEGKLYLDLDCPGTADGKLRVLSKAA